VGDNNDKSLSFSLNLEDDVSDSAERAATSIEDLRARIQSSEEAIKIASASMRRLRGDTDTLKAAKTQLTAKVEAERAKIAQASLALHKQGTSYEELATKARKLAAEQKAIDDKAISALASTVTRAGGPVAALQERFGLLKQIVAASRTPFGFTALAVVGVTAAIAAMVVGVVAGAAALARFIVASADASRSMQLAREAFAGGAQNATNLGTQVDALAAKVVTSRAELNDLAIALAKNGVQGQTLVDTFHAVGQAAAAGAGEAASKLRELVERGRMTQRLQINPFELQGTGLRFDELAKEVAAGTHKTVAEARAALFEGRVPLGQGAAALRAAVEKRFAGINLRKMLSLDHIGETFGKALGRLTEGVDIEPLLRGFGELAKIFDTGTVTGAALKEIVTRIGTGLVAAFEGGAPIVRKFVQGLVIAGLQLEVAYLKVRIALKSAFGDTALFANIDAAATALKAGQIAVYTFGAALAVVAVGIGALVAGAAAIRQTVSTIGASFAGVYDLVARIEWGKLGASVVEGIVAGLNSGVASIATSMVNLADNAKASFKRALGIHSPSKVFAAYGENIPEGVASGVHAGAPRAAAAVEDMAPTPPARGDGIAASTPRIAAGGAPTFHVTIQVDARGATDATVKQLGQPSTFAGVLDVLERIAQGMGSPTPA